MLLLLSGLRGLHQVYCSSRATVLSHPPSARPPHASLDMHLYMLRTTIPPSTTRPPCHSLLDPSPQLSMYDGQRYEVECKYHQFVVTCGRPVWPRLDLTPLAALLNQMEDQEAPHPLTEEGGSGMTWSATRFTDTGEDHPCVTLCGRCSEDQC